MGPVLAGPSLKNSNHYINRSKVMLLTVKKQVEETVEVSTPCYYKTLVGYQHINEAGQIVTVYSSMIAISEPSKDRHYTDDIQRMLQHGKPCEKEEFEYAYNQALIIFNNALLGPRMSPTALITEATAAEGLGAMAE